MSNPVLHLFSEVLTMSTSDFPSEETSTAQTGCPWAGGRTLTPPHYLLPSCTQVLIQRLSCPSAWQCSNSKHPHLCLPAGGRAAKP